MRTTFRLTVALILFVNIVIAVNPDWFSSLNYVEAFDTSQQEFPAPCDGYFLTNAKITTFDSAKPFATRMRTLGTQIAWVGDSLLDYLLTLKANVRPCAIINAKGRRITPAIWDSHVHLLRASIERGCQIYDAELAFSTNAFLAAIQDGMNECNSTDWIGVTGGFNRGSIGEFPTLAQLDAIVPDQPFIGANRYTVPNSEVLLLEGPGFVNSIGLSLLNAAGFALDADGSIPSAKMNPILTFLRNQMTLQDQVDSTKRLFAYLHRKGIIGGLDMHGGFFDIMHGYNAIRKMHRENDLDMALGLGLRAFGLPGGIPSTVNFTASRFGSTRGKSDSLWNAGLGEGFYPITDGGNEAVLTQHFKTVRESNQGDEWALFVNIEFTANVTGTFAALENTRISHGIPEYTWSLEHAYGVSAANLQWLDDNKMFLSVDGSRFLSGQDIDGFRGPPLRTAMQLSADPLIAINTDGRNAAPINWWITAQFCVDGKNATGFPINAAETIPIGKVLEYGTRGTARKVRQLDIRGTLTQGKRADFAVWKQDPLTVAISQIRKTEAKMTFFRGRLVFQQ